MLAADLLQHLKLLLRDETTRGLSAAQLLAVMRSILSRLSVRPSVRAFRMKSNFDLWLR